MKSRTAFCLLLIPVQFLLPAYGAISYATPGSTVTENFNSLSSTATTAWANNSTIPSWFASSGGATVADYYVTNGGNPNAGRLLSLGSTGSSDRALGSQSADSGSSQHAIAVELQNTSTAVLNMFTVTYTGEVWRAITGELADGFTFEYQINGGAWVAYSPLNFTSPVVAPGASSLTLDGNLAANRTVVSSTVTGVDWSPGQTLFLRWTDNGTGGDLQAQIGIDDFSFTAVPEPSAGLLGLAGALGLLARRRR